MESEEAMPIPTPEQLREKTEELKRKLAAGADSIAPPQARALKKRIRRLQRRRRKMLVLRERAASAAKPGESGSDQPASEAKSE